MGSDVHFSHLTIDAVLMALSMALTPMQQQGVLGRGCGLDWYGRRRCWKLSGALWPTSRLALTPSLDYIIEVDVARLRILHCGVMVLPEEIESRGLTVALCRH